MNTQKIAALLLICSAIQVAYAQTPQSIVPSPGPILIRDCNVVSGRRMRLKLHFTNATNVVADEVDVSVRYGGQQRLIRDVGTFSPAIAINHTFSHAFANTGRQEATSCTLAHVRFVDISGVQPEAAPGVALKGCTVTAGRTMWLNVRFANEASSAADEVDLTVQYGREQHIIHNRGSFAPGVVVERAFPHEFTDTGNEETTSCKVLQAHYVGGSSTG